MYAQKKLLLKAIVLHMAIINSQVAWNTDYDKNRNHRYTEY